MADIPSGSGLRPGLAMRRHYRSFFWPVALIAIGIFALLVDLNVISADRLYRLADLWPLVLLVIGLELIARRAFKGAAADLAGALVLLIAIGGAIVYVSTGPAISGETHALDTSDEIGNLTSATLHVDVGAATLTVHSNASLGSALYQAHLEYVGVKPSVTLDTSTGDLRITQNGRFMIFGTRRIVIDMQINPTVKWSFSVNSGAADDTLDLAAVTLGSIELNTGASRADITLGPPTGVVPISIN